MKKFLLGLLFVVLIFVVYWFFVRSKTVTKSSPKDAPLTINTLSNSFNNSIDTVLNNYFELTNAFVNADSLKAKTIGKKLSQSVTNIPLNELKKDTSLKKDALVIYSTDSSSLVDLKSLSDSIAKETTLDNMRHDFASLNESLYSLLKGINYSGKKLYWYNCGMPFGENTSANWISPSSDFQNPYLGKHNSVYKSAMLGCGELQDSIMAK